MNIHFDLFVQSNNIDLKWQNAEISAWDLKTPGSRQAGFIQSFMTCTGGSFDN